MSTAAKKKPSFRTEDLAYMAIGAALTAVCSWITVPSAVPFTLQTFAVFMVLGLLGGRRGTVSILLYILLGAVGLPVFSGFRGGPGILLGNTGGYIAGFLLSGLIYWALQRFAAKGVWAEALVLLAGLLACYASGTAWFMAVYTRTQGAVTPGTVLSWCVIPFILPDLAKLALALLLTGRLRRALRLD